MFQTFTPLSQSFNTPEVKGRKYCEIALAASSDPNVIRGKLEIRPGLLRGLGSLDYHGICVELQAELITNLDGGHVRKASLLTPDPLSPTIYKSRVFTLASGDEAGMRKGYVRFEPRNKLDPTVSYIPFELQIPLSICLPATLSCSQGKINYSIVAYSRADKYKEMERIDYKFTGHHILPVTPSPIQKVTSGGGMRMTLSSPTKFHKVTDKVPFGVSVDMTTENEHLHTFSVTLKLVRRIKFHWDEEEKTEEEVMDSTGWRHIKGKDLPWNSSGKLKLQRIPLGRHPMPTFNEYYAPAIKIQYFLECCLHSDQLNLSTSEEIIIGTGEFPTAESSSPLSPPSFRRSSAARMRWRRVGLSLLSLLPPSYSGVSSRRGSLNSSETCKWTARD